MIKSEEYMQINGNLFLLQGEEALPFGTDSLLLSGYMKKAKKAAELGAGSGVLSLLCVSKGIFATVDAYELQQEAALLCEKNVRFNHLEEQIHVFQADIRTLSSELYESYDAVFTNPPYMKTQAGKECAKESKQIARHETAGDIYDFCKAASGLLRFGGDFYVVYRPNRMADLLDAMRKNRLEVKRITPVLQRKDSAPSSLLVHARKGAKADLYFTKPLILSLSDHEKTEEYTEFLQKGVFNERYFKP